MDNNYGTEYRRKHVVEQISRNKEQIGKSKFILAASALSVGIGTLGTYLFGPDFLNAISADKFQLSVLYFGEALSVSGGLIGGGIYHIIHEGKNYLNSAHNLNSYEEELNEMEKSKGRTL